MAEGGRIGDLYGPTPRIRKLEARVEELEAFVQRFIDAGFDGFDLDRFIALHDEATRMLPVPRRE